MRGRRALVGRKEMVWSRSSGGRVWMDGILFETNYVNKSDSDRKEGLTWEVYNTQ